MTARDKARSIRVGGFVAAALAVLIATVFVLGQERSMFRRKTRVYTSFRDINGLVVGAPVRLAGVDVGRVTDIEFSEDPSSANARVELSIEDRYMERVRMDSRAFIDSKGLLGDKLVNLSVGSPAQPALRDGDEVIARAGTSFEAVAQQLEVAASAVGRVATTADDALGDLASPEVVDNLRRVTGSLAALLAQIEHGDGIAHRLLYDPSAAEHVANTLANLDRISAQAGAATARLERVLARIEQGPGTLHTLAYGDEGSLALADLQRAAGGVATITDKLNRGDGLAGALLQDDQGKQLLADMAEFAARLNRIGHDVERGRGTVGGLLVDPSVYEDLKSTLGNIERNVVFKALVRMTIKEDGLKRPAEPAVLVEP
jgi:phospholipid/cholesterol/gamma-HCH transport system substrate-binding protein